MDNMCFFFKRVAVPDERFTHLCDIYKPKSEVMASLTVKKKKLGVHIFVIICSLKNGLDLMRLACHNFFPLQVNYSC